MPPQRTLAHLSDLHFGLAPHVEVQARAFVSMMTERRVDRVIVTGDVTHRGREDEYEAFVSTFAPLFRDDRITVIPGNHDRSGDDVARHMMDDSRVRTTVDPGLYVIELDTTGPHNRVLWRGHGMITTADLEALDRALQDAPPDHLVVLSMHHHPYPLPEEGALERLSSWAGLPYADEIESGETLLEVVVGRTDLLLHGHRHIPSTRIVENSARPLRIYNAGSSSELGRARVFTHRAGALEVDEWWKPYAAATTREQGWIGRWMSNYTALPIAW